MSGIPTPKTKTVWNVKVSFAAYVWPKMLPPNRKLGHLKNKTIVKFKTLSKDICSL